MDEAKNKTPQSQLKWQKDYDNLKMTNIGILLMNIARTITLVRLNCVLMQLNTALIIISSSTIDKVSEYHAEYKARGGTKYSDRITIQLYHFNVNLQYKKMLFVISF